MSSRGAVARPGAGLRAGRAGYIGPGASTAPVSSANGAVATGVNPGPGGCVRPGPAMRRAAEARRGAARPVTWG
jgi:hypothetical protein